MNDEVKIFIGRLPGPFAQVVGFLADKVGLAGGHFRLWRKLGYPRCIMNGSFADMRYLPTAVGSAIIPKWIGVYELELLGVLERWKSEKFDRIIDVGAADGYYAVGLSLHYNVPAVCFDTSPYAQSVLKRIAKLNGVLDRLDVRGTCDQEGLQNALKGSTKTLLVMDCEGYEDVLLDPTQTPDLVDAWILVECHDCFVKGVTERLQNRFSNSHVIETIDVQPRDLSAIQQRYGFTEEEAAFATNEGRPKDMKWLAMRPLKTPAIEATG